MTSTTYTTKTGQKIVCTSYKAFMTIAKKYFPQIKLTEWKAQ